MNIKLKDPSELESTTQEQINKIWQEWEDYRIILLSYKQTNLFFKVICKLTWDI